MAFAKYWPVRLLGVQFTVELMQLIDLLDYSANEGFQEDSYLGKRYAVREGWGTEVLWTLGEGYK